MTNRDAQKIIRTQIEPKLDEIRSEFEKIHASDIMDEVIRTSRNLNSISAEDLLRPFTI